MVSNLEGILDFSVEYYCFEFTMMYCSFIIGERIYRQLTCTVYHLRSQKLLQNAVVSKVVKVTITRKIRYNLEKYPRCS